MIQIARLLENQFAMKMICQFNQLIHVIAHEGFLPFGTNYWRVKYYQEVILWVRLHGGTGIQKPNVLTASGPNGLVHVLQSPVTSPERPACCPSVQPGHSVSRRWPTSGSSALFLYPPLKHSTSQQIWFLLFVCNHILFLPPWAHSPNHLECDIWCLQILQIAHCWLCSLRWLITCILCRIHGLYSGKRWKSG